jgi:hypothetical protein
MLYTLFDRAIISVLLIYSVVVYCRALKIDGVGLARANPAGVGALGE